MTGSSADHSIALALAGMAVASACMRLFGFWFMRYVPLTPRVRRVLDAMPGSVIIAAILPGALRGGPVMLASVGAAIAVMLVLRNDFVAVLAAVAVAIAIRFGGFGL